MAKVREQRHAKQRAQRHPVEFEERLSNGGVELLHLTVEIGRGQLIAIGEVAVDRGGRDTGSLGDRDDRQAIYAGFGDHFGGRRNDPLDALPAALLLWRSPNLGHRRILRPPWPGGPKTRIQLSI
ncbi:MAG: hypothetical protein HZB14_04950 [Actinobacteria bacterium]|nr:hypothetical protein [Actinomycetota bacterium]